MVKSKTKTTVNVDAVKKDVQKMAKEMVQKTPAHQSHQELAPGSVKRQSPAEQRMGTKKYREMIHNHNKKNKHLHEKLPFTFLPKRKIRSHMNVVLVCPECEAPISGSEFTYAAICSKCNKVVKPYNPEAEKSGYHKTKRTKKEN